MCRKITLLLLFFVPVLSQAQSLVSSTKLGARTRNELLAEFQVPFIQYGVDYYRIVYTTTNTQGLPDTVSGLVVVPDDPTRIYPRLVYQHGTAGSTMDVPSFNVNAGGEGIIGWLFGGLGYVALLPDYLGLGVSDGFHPYVHAASEAQTGVDILRAFNEFALQNGVYANDQLFITGYSQGGHAAMALHREIALNFEDTFSVTAAAHLSGPYSMSGVMRNLFISDEVYPAPGYVPYTVLSYQTAYGNIFNQVEDVFKAAYAPAIGQFFNNQISLGQLNDQLSAALVANEGSVRPVRMFQDSFLQNVVNQPNHPFNQALADNDTYAWAPESPTRIFYCMADDQVPFENGVVAVDTMLALGAQQTQGLDVNPAADHGDCVLPALTQTFFFFLPYQQIGTVGTSAPWAAGKLEIWPNLVSEEMLVRDLPSDGLLRVMDMSGKTVLEQAVSAGNQSIQMGSVPEGLYLVGFTAEGRVWHGKVVVRR